MTLIEKVQAVEAVFAKLDREISAFQGWSKLHCKAGCGKCCFKADIEATALEFLPLAHFLYQNNLAFQWLEDLESNPSDICRVLNPSTTASGLCSQYPYRGLICRLFGYSARINKYGVKELVTCQVIKTEQQENYEQASAQIRNGEAIPVMSHYYMQLHSIDHQLAQHFYPINQAIRRAIETVLQYYAYRN